MRINIIGAGLAGCALAYILKNKGHEPVIYEASPVLASGASGNEVGLYNPRMSAQLDPSARYYKAAFEMAYELFSAVGDDIDWRGCGLLNIMNTQQKQVRFPKSVASWGWPDDEFSIVTADEASRLSSVEIPFSALFLSKSGKISPKKLCAFYAQGVEVHLNTEISDLSDLHGDAVILACAMGAKAFPCASHLPLKAVRGQVSYIHENVQSAPLRTVLSYGGYIAPSESGLHCVGATFQRWLDHSELLAEDDVRNIEMLCEAIPYLRGAPFEAVKARAGVRTTAPDHFPIVGQLEEGVYISAAHGSHGILSSLLSANILSDLAVGHAVRSVDDGVLDALSPQRFK